MKIEAGKRYILRNGDKTKKLELTEYRDGGIPPYPFYDKGTGILFSEKGKYWDDGRNSEMDIMAEYIKPKKEKKVNTGTVSIWEYQVDFLDNEGFVIESQPRTVISANCAADDDMAFKVVCAWADEMMDEYSAHAHKITQMK